MRQAFLRAFALATTLAGCATPPGKPPITTVVAPPDVPRTWQTLITARDRTRVDALGATWTRALAAVPRRLAGRVTAEGPLAAHAAGLEQPALPPGPYYCRLVRFGGRAGIATFQPDFCIVAATSEGVSFTKQNGRNLFGGWLFADTATRQVFLGTSRPRASDPGPNYGTDPNRDVAGVVERVSAFRWRLALTRAAGGAVLDVYELVPVTPKVPGAQPAVPG